MPLISIDSRKHLFYEEYGQGIPIIFIHPPGMGRKVFYYQRLLSKHFRVIFLALRGQWDSDHIEQAALFAYYAGILPEAESRSISASPARTKCPTLFCPAPTPLFIT